MLKAHQLLKPQLEMIVDRIQTVIYGEGANREWDSETIEEVAEVLWDYGMVPEEKGAVIMRVMPTPDGPKQVKPKKARGKKRASQTARRSPLGPSEEVRKLAEKLADS